MIHELTHKYAATNDYEKPGKYSYYLAEYGSRFRQEGGGIDASSLVKNADSYSWLCLSCAHATLDPRRNGLSDDKAFNSSCLNGIISNDISRFNLSMVGGA